MSVARVLMLGAVLGALITAVAIFSISTTLRSCTTRADELLSAADPLDRHPPRYVSEKIKLSLRNSDISDILASVLLDRFKCRRANGSDGVDWMLDKAALRWWLPRVFGDQELIALYARTADMTRGIVGISRGARAKYRRNITDLQDNEVECLIRQAAGIGGVVCGNENFPALPIYHYPRMP